MTPTEGVSSDQRPCELHVGHRPRALVTVKHHVQPLGMGGPDVPDNWRWTCDTGHRNVHEKLAELVFNGAMSDGATASERHTAQTGYDMWVAAGKPGNPHAAYALTRRGVDATEDGGRL